MRVGYCRQDVLPLGGWNAIGRLFRRTKINCAEYFYLKSSSGISSRADQAMKSNQIAIACPLPNTCINTWFMPAWFLIPFALPILNAQRITSLCDWPSLAAPVLLHP
jgi:hypothetical protein